MVKISCLRLELECFFFYSQGLAWNAFVTTSSRYLALRMIKRCLRTFKHQSLFVCSRATCIVYKRNTWRTISSTMVTNKNNVVAVFVLCIPLEDLFTLQTGPPSVNNRQH